ncbi:MAG TPA: hypothetical protein VG389_25160 [Myxococcota bacterium]|nr:hypothetical protein [Myxococcota bacterium]
MEVSPIDMTPAPPAGGTERAGGGAGTGAAGRRAPQPSWPMALVGAFLGAASGALVWLIYARLAAVVGAVASLAVGFGAGLGLRLVGQRSGVKEGLAAVGVAAAGIAAGELMARLLVPRILAEERGFTLAYVMEQLGSTQLRPLDFVFHAAGLYFAYRVASLPSLPRAG